MEDNKMGQLGFKIDTGELATSTIPEDFTAPEELYNCLLYTSPSPRDRG